MTQFPVDLPSVYHPTDALLPWLYSLLGAAMGLYPLRVVVTAWTMSAHPEFAEMGMTSALPPELMGPAMTLGCVACMELAVWIAWYVLFLVWVYRTAVNVRVAIPGAGAGEFSPRVCVVGLLPIVNLVMSPVVMSDLVLASQGRQVRGLRVSPLALAWWGSLVAAVIASFVTGMATHPKGLNQAQLVVPLTALHVLAGSAYLVLTLVLVRRVQRVMAGLVGTRRADVYGREPEPWEV